MSGRLSRRKLANYYAKSLIEGLDSKRLTNQLAAYLIESKRTKELPSIVDEIEYQLSLKGLLLVDVVTKSNLNEPTKQVIVEKVKNQAGAKKVYLREFVDKSVLGGIKLRFPGAQIDRTISRGISLLKTNHKK